MLQDEAEDHKENMQIRSHSVGAKSILGLRSLNVQSAAGEASGAVKPAQNVITVAADAQIVLLTFSALLCRISMYYRDAQDRLLWRDKTCPART